MILIGKSKRVNKQEKYFPQVSFAPVGISVRIKE